MIIEVCGILWNVIFVPEKSEYIQRSDGSFTYGATDLNTKCIYISKEIHGGLLKKVLIHEIIHCYIFANDIYLPIYIEEYICDALTKLYEYKKGRVE